MRCYYLKNTELHFGESIALLAVSIVALLMIPGAAIPLALSFTFLYLIVAVAYSCLPSCHRLGQWSILVAATLMAVGIVLNVWYFTTYSGGSLAQPVLVNDDSNRLFTYAVQFFNNEPITEPVRYVGFPYLMCAVWSITGVTILVPLLINFFFTLLSLLLCHVISVRLLEHHIDSARLPLAGAISLTLTAACCYYIGSGMVILKEPGIFLGIALIAAVYARIDSRYNVLLLTIGTGLIALNRTHFLYILIPFMWLFAERRSLRLIIFYTVLMAAILLIGHLFTTRTINDYINVGISGQLKCSGFTPEHHGIYNSFVDRYFDFHIWKRILFIPFTAGVQYFVPFPWNFMRDTEFGISQIYSHISYLWYAVGGLCLYFFVLKPDFKSHRKLWKWVVFSLALYLVPAYIVAGSVSRYWLPFIPLFTAIGSYVFINVIDSHNRKKFYIWMSYYTALVAVVLIVCYNIMLL